MALHFNNTQSVRNHWKEEDKIKCIKLFTDQEYTVDKLAVEFSCKKDRIVKLLRRHGHSVKIKK